MKNLNRRTKRPIDFVITPARSSCKENQGNQYSETHDLEVFNSGSELGVFSLKISLFGCRVRARARAKV